MESVRFLGHAIDVSEKIESIVNIRHRLFRDFVKVFRPQPQAMTVCHWDVAYLWDAKNLASPEHTISWTKTKSNLWNLSKHVLSR
jgi:hypothetical protein